MKRTKALDGMRGWVVLAVVVYHAWQYVGGQAHHDQSDPFSSFIRCIQWTVVWFFIATGLLLYMSYTRRVINGQDPGGPLSFLGRRLLRVLPAYWVAILVIWTVRNVGASPANWEDLLRHLTLTHVFDQKLIFYTIGPAWSLTSQVIVYFIIALAWVPQQALATRLRGRNARTALLAVLPLVMIAIGVVYQVQIVANGVRSTDFPAMFSPLAQLPALAVGMLIGLVIARWRPMVHGQFATVLVALAMAVSLVPQAWYMLTTPNTPATTLVFHALSTMSSAVALAGVMMTSPQTWLHRALSWSPLVFIGTIGYSIYLWHEPMLLQLDEWGVLTPHSSIWLAVPVLLISAVLIGWVMYHLVEVPLGSLSALIRPSVGFADRYVPGRLGDRLPIDTSDGFVDPLPDKRRADESPENSASETGERESQPA